MEQSITSEIIMHGVILLFSLVAIWGSIKELRKYRRLAKEGNSVLARIIGYETDNSGDTPTYPALVTFKGPNGINVTSKSKTSSSFKPTVGNEVEILYDSSYPNEFYYQKSIAPFVFTVLIIASVVGIGFTAIRLYKFLYLGN
jgi:hypothetical protein